MLFIFSIIKFVTLFSIFQNQIPSPDTTCSNCNVSDNTAEVRCMDCKEYLCDSCYASHKKLKAMKNHRIVTMEDILSGEVNIFSEVENMCQDHGEMYKYYCEDENRAICQDCVILKVCSPEHDRITLERAAENQSNELYSLLQKSTETLRKFQKAVSATEIVGKELEVNSQLAKEKLRNIENDYIELVKKKVKEFEDEIDQIRTKRMEDLVAKRTNLSFKVKLIQNANDITGRVLKSGSKMEVISTHASVASKLYIFSESEPMEIDKRQGCIKFNSAIPIIPTIGQIMDVQTPAEKWKLKGHFTTGEFDDIHGLAINHKGNIALASWEQGVKIFSRDGQVKCVLYDSPGSVNVAITESNEYITSPRGTQQIKITDCKGRKVCSFPITDMSDKPSNINSLTVDPSGRIIVGQLGNTVSIHHSDGSVISKFATKCRPFRLAVTSNGEIVSSMNRGTSLQLMDFSGGNVRVIKPPAAVKAWNPGYVYCRQGEIFVANEGSGDPSGIYRYTAEGTYLGCVTTDVKDPSGIALSEDGLELFVAELTDPLVKIFQRS